MTIFVIVRIKLLPVIASRTLTITIHTCPRIDSCLTIQDKNKAIMGYYKIKPLPPLLNSYDLKQLAVIPPFRHSAFNQT